MQGMAKRQALMILLLWHLSAIALLRSADSWAIETGNVNAVKVALVLNVAKYTHWYALKENHDIQICVPRVSGLESNLEKLNQRVVNGHRIKVRLDINMADLAGCHILIVGHLPLVEQRAWHQRRAGSAVVMVGEKSLFHEGLDVWFFQRGTHLAYGLAEETSKSRGFEFHRTLVSLAQR